MSDEIYFDFPAMVTDLRQHWLVTCQMMQSAREAVIATLAIAAETPSMLNYDLVTQDYYEKLRIWQVALERFRDDVQLSDIAHRRMSDIFSELFDGMRIAEEIHQRAITGPYGIS